MIGQLFLAGLVQVPARGDQAGEGMRAEGVVVSVAVAGPPFVVGTADPPLPRADRPDLS
jgi:hypothetical protein